MLSAEWFENLAYCPRVFDFVQQHRTTFVILIWCIVKMNLPVHQSDSTSTTHSNLSPDYFTASKSLYSLFCSQLLGLTRGPHRPCGPILPRRTWGRVSNTVHANSDRRRACAAATKRRSIVDVIFRPRAMCFRLNAPLTCPRCLCARLCFRAVTNSMSSSIRNAISLVTSLQSECLCI